MYLNNDFGHFRWLTIVGYSASIYKKLLKQYYVLSCYSTVSTVRMHSSDKPGLEKNLGYLCWNIPKV